MRFTKAQIEEIKEITRRRARRTNKLLFILSFVLGIITGVLLTKHDELSAWLTQ